MNFIKKLVNLVILIAFSSSAFGTKCSTPEPANNQTKIPCQQILDQVVSCNSDFLDKAMLNSDPFTICIASDSSQSYRWMMSHYNHLMTYHDDANDGGTCASQFLGKNRMEVIINTIQYAKNIWSEANCDNCYESSPSNELMPNISKNTLTFFNASKNYDICVKNASNIAHNYTLICDACKENYLTMNEIYESIKESFGYYKTCFDIQDQMNRTRLQWSGTFGCCHEDHTDLTAFWIVVSIFFTCFVGFYLVAFFIGMRQKTAGHLDANDITGNEGQPRLSDPTQVPGSSSINCDESDDDDPLLRVSEEPEDPKNQNLLDLNE